MEDKDGGTYDELRVLPRGWSMGSGVRRDEQSGSLQPWRKWSSGRICDDRGCRSKTGGWDVRARRGRWGLMTCRTEGPGPGGEPAAKVEWRCRSLGLGHRK